MNLSSHRMEYVFAKQEYKCLQSWNVNGVNVVSFILPCRVVKTVSVQSGCENDLRGSHILTISIMCGGNKKPNISYLSQLRSHYGSSCSQTNDTGHYDDGIMERWRLKSPASPLFTQPFIQTQIKENIKAPRHWPLCGEFTGDRWILRTNGQLRGKCLHLMTSSWVSVNSKPEIRFLHMHCTMGHGLWLGNHAQRWCQYQRQLPSVAFRN